MAGRHRLPAHTIPLRDPPPPSLLARAPPPFLDDPLLARRLAALEDQLALQHREIQTLLLDNQRLAAVHVALKQDLAAAQADLRAAASAAVKLKETRDAEVREVYERAVRLEADARVVEGMRVELAQVRSDVQKLGAAKEEMVERLKGMKGELARVRADLGQGAAVRAEIEVMKTEIQRGRAAVEYEKKAHADNLEQSMAMEKNMLSMAREVEKLRAELANAEKRARAAAAAAAAAKPGPGYVEPYGNSEIAYGGSTYADAYSLHQAQRGVDGGSQYGSGPVSHGPYGIQQTQAHR